MKLRLRHREKLYRFLGIEQAGDWSIVITWDRRRNGTSIQHWSPHSTEILESNAGDEPMRLTYHTSGQVNFHGWVKRSPAYFEPLSMLAEARIVIAFSIPEASRLDRLEKALGSSEPVLDLLDEIGDERFTVGVAFCPRDLASPPNVMMRIDYDVFSILLLRIPDFRFPPTLAEHFHHVAAEGVFAGRPVGKDAAMLAYHQKRVGASSLGIYPPNGEGVYTLFTSVEMRVVPQVTIIFSDTALRVEVLWDRARPMMIPFRVFRGNQRITKADLRDQIVSIELNAEL